MSQCYKNNKKENPSLLYPLALWRTQGIGPAKFAQQLANTSQTTAIKIPEENWLLAEKDLAWSKQVGCFILTLDDARYPVLLKHIASPPPLLFVQGEIETLAQTQLAIVGSRQPTPAGRDTAYQFAKYLASAGLVVTSGLAFGIDAASHEGALDGGGKTIAVLGTGPDIIYPKAHQALAQKIIKNGCLVSEFPLGVKPHGHHFPRRNRLISGLSRGVLVVEAAYASGSLLTAKYALEQNREVFAIPGSIHNPLARGCHALIKQGAKLTETAQDILEEYGFLKQLPALEKKSLPSPKNTVLLDAEKQLLLEHLQFDQATSIDTLVQRTNLTAEKVSSMLLLLELDAFVQGVPGGYIRLITHT